MAEIRELSQHVGQSVTLQGWVEGTRGHGKVAFLVLRDGTGVVPGVIVKSQVAEDDWELYGSLTPEALVQLTRRGEGGCPGPRAATRSGSRRLSCWLPRGLNPIQPKEHGGRLPAGPPTLVAAVLRSSAPA